MAGTITLTTQHLSLRRYRTEDVGSLYRDFGADERMYEYTGWNPYATPQRARATVEGTITGYKKDNFYGWVIEHGGIVVGTIGAYDAAEDKSAIEVGVSIARRFWGRGYATEALTCVLNYLTREGYRSVRAWCADKNLASRKGLEKAGMRVLSVEKDAIRVGEKKYDKLNYIYKPNEKNVRTQMILDAVLIPENGKKLMQTIYEAITQFSDVVEVGKLGLKGALFGLGAIGDGATNAVLTLLRPVLESVVKDEVLTPFHIAAKVDIIKIRKQEESLRITVAVKDVDYVRSLTPNLPLITKALREKLSGAVLCNILDVLQDDTPAAVSAVLKAVSNRKKDEIVRLLVGAYHKEICDFLTQLLTDNRIKLTVKELAIQ